MSALRPLTASILPWVSVASPTAPSSCWSWLVHRSQVASVPLPLPPVGLAEIAMTVVPLLIGCTGPVPWLFATRACRTSCGLAVIWGLVVRMAAPASAAHATATRADRAVMVIRLNIGRLLLGWVGRGPDGRRGRRARLSRPRQMPGAGRHGPALIHGALRRT